jgi:hypothetical protein
MDTEQVRLILWIVAGLLMVGGVLGIGLALILGIGSTLPPSEAARPPKSRSAPATAVSKRVAPRVVDEKVLAGRRAAYRQGILVFVGLLVLTALEFWVAAGAGGSIVFLFILILAKAGLIVQYYMHLGRAWGEEEAH